MIPALKIKLYGVPLSQPFRAVAWTLLQQQVPFTVQLTVPGATTRIGSNHESYLQKSGGRTDRVPLLEEFHEGEEQAESFTLIESPAILSYLCESRQWMHLYAPSGSRQKALIDSYLHWHHEGTRKIASLTRPMLRPELQQPLTPSDQQAAEQALRILDQAWFKDTPFIASNEHHSIADLIAYEEIAQVHYLAPDLLQLERYPRLLAFVERMRQLPYHEQAHMALHTLASSTDNEPIAKRLGAATKAGLNAMEQAQQGFDKSSATSNL